MTHPLGPIFAAAESYAQAKLSVIPIRPDGSKAPPFPWKQYQSQIATPEERSRWWANGSGYGIAVIAGAVSGNLECLDFDEPAAFTAWTKRLKAAAPTLAPRLVLTRTPGPGYQCLYRSEDPLPGNQVLARRQTTDPATGEIKILTLIETRAEGGYFVAPPSGPACHPNGKPYTLLHGDLSNPPVLTSQERALLLQCAAALNEYAEPRIVSRAPTAPADAMEERLRPGTDYNARGSWERLLTRSGWVLEGTRGEVEEWKRPGKAEHGISATLHAVAPGVFYVFSTSAAPFAAGHGYDLFAARAWLEFDGDFKACAKALGDEGYGEARAAPAQRAAARVTEKVTDPGASVVSVVNTELLRQPPQALEPEALIGLAGDVVRAIAPHTESHPAAMLVSFLVEVGCAVGRTPYVYRDGARHACNEFACIVGLSASSRKGTATRRINEVVLNSGSKYARLHTSDGLGSGEALIASICEDGGTGPNADRRRLVFEEEFSLPLKVMRREGSTLSENLRKAWDGGTLASRTKGRKMEAKDAHVAVLGHITEDELRRELGGASLFNGFANRFLWVCASRVGLLPFGGGDVPTAPLVMRLHQVLEFSQTLQRLEFAPATRRLWAEGGLYEMLTRRPHGLLGAVTSRAEAHVTRLALLYAVMDSARDILPEHLLAALAVWDYSERSCKYLFGVSSGDDMADQIHEWLLEVHPGYLTRTDIRDRFGRNAPAGAIPAALALLEAHGRASLGSVATGGRNAGVWVANMSPANDQNDGNDRSPLQQARALLRS